ncbi:MAG: hypothetical protein ACXVCX_20435, partial [Ktedonobacterales bacterium]
PTRYLQNVASLRGLLARYRGMDTRTMPPALGWNHPSKQPTPNSQHHRSWGEASSLTSLRPPY